MGDVRAVDPDDGPTAAIRFATPMSQDPAANRFEGDGAEAVHGEGDPG